MFCFVRHSLPALWVPSRAGVCASVICLDGPGADRGLVAGLTASLSSGLPEKIQTARKTTRQPLIMHSIGALPCVRLRQTARVGDPSTPLPTAAAVGQGGRFSWLLLVTRTATGRGPRNLRGPGPCTLPPALLDLSLRPRRGVGGTSQGAFLGCWACLAPASFLSWLAVGVPMAPQRPAQVLSAPVLEGKSSSRRGRMSCGS